MNAWQVDSAPIAVSEAWSALNLATLSGLLLIVGAPDTGKSTFAHWLFHQLIASGRRVAFLDGDVGQSVLGPPTTLTLALPEPSSDKSLSHWFIGDTSPRGHMLPLVVGAGQLARRAREAGVETIVVDTTGLVNRAQGGVALKQALVDQLQPAVLFGLQRGDELEPILAPLRQLARPTERRRSSLAVRELPVSDAVRRRDTEARRQHRAAAFRRYFRGAESLCLSLRHRAVFDGQIFSPGRLLALQDPHGFALALGVVQEHDEARDILKIHTPWRQVDAVASVRLGAIGVDLASGQDFRPGRKP